MKSSIKFQEFLRNPFVLFLPFLILSIIIVIISNKQGLIGDENKYLNFSNNLLQGYYSYPPSRINIDVGPGYSLLLMPFIALKFPYISIKLLNAFLYYLSIIFVYKSLQIIVTNKIALIASIFWALYYNIYENLQTILPEILIIFLIALFLFLLLKVFVTSNLKTKRYTLLAGLIFGYIALTKIIFGYVLLLMLLGNGLLWIFYRHSLNYRKSLTILIIAFITTAPYLIYTFQLTGRIFYWGTTAGNNIYWMSTPYSVEYGSWFPSPKAKNDSVNSMKSISEFRRNEYKKIIMNDQNLPGTEDYIRYNHLKDFERISDLKSVEQDYALKRIAFNNIKEHPFKYIQNCFSNMGRMLFNFPYSYKMQSPMTLFRLPHNGILITLMLLVLFPTIYNWKKVLYPIRFFIFVFLLYIGGSITGSAEIRMFTVIVPFLLIWISFVLQRIVEINWRFRDS